jgi:hypothetical protein
MSKYKILRCNDKDPKKIRKQNRRLIIVFSIVYILIFLTSNLKIFAKQFLILNTLTPVILILITVFLIKKIRKQSKQMLQIGTMEFTKSSIKIEIEDFKTEYHFDSVQKIEVEKHLQAVTVFESKSGYLTYILKIIHQNLKTDHFILSDRSIDFGQKMGLIDTLRTLQRIAHTNIVISTN